MAASTDGHRPQCRTAIFHGTRFEKDWPADPDRCDLCAAQTRTRTPRRAKKPGQRRRDHEPRPETTAICPDLEACTRLAHPELVPGESCECCGLIVGREVLEQEQ